MKCIEMIIIIYNQTPVTQQSSLYQANYYVVNEDLRVYICIHNGTDKENENGRPSYDQPTFIDLEQKSSRNKRRWIYLEISLYN